MGILAGASSIAAGIINYDRQFGSATPDDYQRSLSVINIGMGSASLFMGILNMVNHHTGHDKSAARKIDYNLYPVTLNTQQGLGFSVVKRF